MFRIKFQILQVIEKHAFINELICTSNPVHPVHLQF